MLLHKRQQRLTHSKRIMNEKHSGTLVAIKSIPIHDGERVLVFNSGDGTLGLAMAERCSKSHFLLYESHVGMSNSLLRKLQSSSNFSNVRVISEFVSHANKELRAKRRDELAQLRQTDNLLDVVVFEPRRFTALDLTRFQILVGKPLLKQGGRFYLVTHKRAGSSRHEKMLAEIFGVDVRIVGKGRGGYKVLEAIKNSILCSRSRQDFGVPETNEQTQTEWNPRRKIHFEIFDIKFDLESEPSLFSKDDLDLGTRILLENVNLSSFERMLDLGCGWGAIGLVAAVINKNGHVVLTDIDSRAAKVASDNVQRLGLQNRVSVIATDDVRQIDGSFDLILSNPPFHADMVTLVNLFQAASDKLRKKGATYVVVEKTYLSKLKKVLEQTFRHVRVYHEDMNTNFFVLVSRK